MRAVVDQLHILICFMGEQRSFNFHLSERQSVHLALLGYSKSPVRSVLLVDGHFILQKQ